MNSLCAGGMFTGASPLMVDVFYLLPTASASDSSSFDQVICRRAFRSSTKEYVSVAITSSRNGIDVTAGTELGIWNAEGVG